MEGFIKIDKELDNIFKYLNEFYEEITESIQVLRDFVQQRLAEFDKYIKEQIEQIKTYVNGEVSKIREEFKTFVETITKKITDIDNTLNKKIDDLNKDVTTRISSKGNKLLFTSAGSFEWTVPDGVTRVCLSMKAGGGAGQWGEKPHDDTYIDGGNGGDGEEFLYRFVDVVPNSKVTIVVGAGGTAPSEYHSPYSPTGGGNSSFGSIVALGGGVGTITNMGASGQPPNAGRTFFTYGLFPPFGRGGHGCTQYQYYPQAGTNGYVLIEW